MPINLDNVTNITLGNTPVEQVTDSQGNVLWSSAVDPSTVYFYVEDVSGADNTLSVTKLEDNAPTIEVFKSTDGTNWSSMGTTSTTGITTTIPANGKLYLKATADCWGYHYYRGNIISASGNHNVGGNIMSLIYGSSFIGKTDFPEGTTYNFRDLFTGNTHLISAANLILPPTVTNDCYTYTFGDCTSLIQAPALPATTLVSGCYWDMFGNCTSLTQAPTLPATTLDTGCYYSMFKGCTSLTTAPTLPATTLANNCYSNMFNNCTSLTTAPVLPATTLASTCYYCMFQGCTSLNKVVTYANDRSASHYLFNWLNGVASTGTFYNMACTTYPSGASGIPAGWTELHTLNDTINVTITNTGNYTGATYQIDSGTAQPINETGTTSFTVPVTATTLTIHRNGKGVTDVLGICGYSEDSDWDAAFPVGKMTDNVSIDIMSLM